MSWYVRRLGSFHRDNTTGYTRHYPTVLPLRFGYLSEVVELLSHKSLTSEKESKILFHTSRGTSFSTLGWIEVLRGWKICIALESRSGHDYWIESRFNPMIS